MPHSSVNETISRLRADYPETPFIALGQTVFWDEPVKAAWRMLLDELWPTAKMIAGVHDTDYFAKTTALIGTDDEYALLPHNDGATRGLWSAAGELSTLFGSEDVPTRAMYERSGVPFSRLASKYSGGKRKFYEDMTEAWGWRGIALTGAETPIAHDVPLSEFGPILLTQLEWGFSRALKTIAPEAREACQRHCQNVVGWVSGFIGAQPASATLTDLYRHLLPLFYRSLLNANPSNFETTSSVSLFRFNVETASLPRFGIVELFLGLESRAICEAAYNRAVTGGGMYALDTFGEGAVPFDVVVAGRGRGTLRIMPRAVAIDFHDKPHVTTVSEPVTTRHALAELLVAEFGENVALVGKAVSLIDMLAAEFIVLFHETASGYTPRTTAMNDEIRAAGIALDLKPIVRIAYPTWDALASADVETPVVLPSHLAHSFGTGANAIAAKKFGSRWRDVVASQKAEWKRLSEARRPRAILAILEATDKSGDCWTCDVSDYERALEGLRSAQTYCLEQKQRISFLRAHIREDTAACVQADRDKGDDFRKTLFPLIQQVGTESAPKDLADRIDAEEVRRKRTYDTTISGCEERIRNAKAEIKRLRAECRAIERSADCLEHRKTIEDVTLRAEFARAELIRKAFITCEALPHTQARPSAWWLPTLDPTGAWFKAIVDGTQARLERV
jgi:hypothetical protein